MHTIFLATVASLAFSADLTPGSLLFLEDSNRIVETVTGDDISQVAIVMRHNGAYWVYEAEPAKVRRMPLRDYYQEIADLNRDRRTKMKVWWLRPKTPYRESDLAKMKVFLDKQVGRRYSIRNYVRRRPGDGIHCAELAAEMLASSERYDLKRAYAFNPGTLLKQVQPQHRNPRLVSLPAATPKKSWCQESWIAWRGYRDWCLWSCYEAWMFCR